jgi:uncharacterized membrane-anchored protein YitT (DUF2179 family)
MLYVEFIYLNFHQQVKVTLYNTEISENATRSFTVSNAGETSTVLDIEEYYIHEGKPFMVCVVNEEN